MKSIVNKFHPKNNRYKEVYSFKTTMVDLHLVSKECTPKNPLVIVDINGLSGNFIAKYVILYYSMVEKVLSIDTKAIEIENIQHFMKLCDISNRSKDIKGLSVEGPHYIFEIGMNEESFYMEAISWLNSAPYNRNLIKECQATVKIVELNR